MRFLCLRFYVKHIGLPLVEMCSTNELACLQVGPTEAGRVGSYVHRLHNPIIVHAHIIILTL